MITFNAYDMERPAIPAVIESRDKTANNAAKTEIKVPMNSKRIASHLFDMLFG
jgi:hypothetical protein